MTPFTLQDHNEKYGDTKNGYPLYGKTYTDIVEKYQINAVLFKKWCVAKKIRLIDDKTVRVMTTDKAVEEYKKYKEDSKPAYNFDDNIRNFCRRVKKVKLSNLSYGKRLEVREEYYARKRKEWTIKHFKKIYDADKRQFTNWLNRTKKMTLESLSEAEITQNVEEFKLFFETRMKWMQTIDKPTTPIKTKKPEKPKEKLNKWQVTFKRMGIQAEDLFNVKSREEAIKECMNRYNIGEKAIKKVEYV